MQLTAMIQTWGELELSHQEHNFGTIRFLKHKMHTWTVHILKMKFYMHSSLKWLQTRDVNHII